jgi:hypothetical protein
MLICGLLVIVVITLYVVLLVLVLALRHLLLVHKVWVLVMVRIACIVMLLVGDLGGGDTAFLRDGALVVGIVDLQLRW